MENKRVFYVDTPFGKLKVWAKHDTSIGEFDDPEDYPGVYIDLVRTGVDPKATSHPMVCCVEYDPGNSCIRTTAWNVNGVNYVDEQNDPDVDFDNCTIEESEEDSDA